MKVFRFFVTSFLLFSPLFAEEMAAKESSYTNDLLRMLSTMIILLIFIAGALFFVKKMMKSRLNFINKSTSIKVIERRALNPKASLYLIDVLGKKVLISEAQGRVNLITEINHPISIEEETMEEAPKTNFAEFLKKKLSKSIAS